MNIKALPFILLTGFCFGSSLVGSRFALGQFDALTFVTTRITLAALAFLIIYRLSPKHRFPTDRETWLHGGVLALISTAIPMYGFVYALNFLSSGVTSTINTTNPAITIVLAHFLLKGERLTARTAFGVVLALGGAVILALRGETGLSSGTNSGFGYLLVFTGVIAISSSAIYARRFAQNVPPFDLTAIQIIIAAAFALPLHALFVGFDYSAVNLTGGLAVLYGAVVGTFFAFNFFFYLVNEFGATTAAMTPYIVILVATLGGVLFLGEQVTGVMLLGMATIVAGIAIINSRQRVAG